MIVQVEAGSSFRDDDEVWNPGRLPGGLLSSLIYWLPYHLDAPRDDDPCHFHPTHHRNHIEMVVKEMNTAHD